MAKQRKTPSHPTIDPALRADIEAAIPPASNLSAALLSFLRGAHRRGLTSAKIAEILCQHGYQFTAEDVAAQLAPRGKSNQSPADTSGKSSGESAARPDPGAGEADAQLPGRNGA